MTESCPPSSPQPHPPGSDAPGCGGSDRSSAAAATRRPPLGPTAGEGGEVGIADVRDILGKKTEKTLEKILK